MPGDLSRILSLEVPIIVRLGERSMTVGEVLSMIPGTIIELPKGAEEELDLLVNNKVIGCGSAVKVGENFGLRVSFTGDVRSRVQALSPDSGVAGKLAAAEQIAQLSTEHLTGKS